MLHGLFLMMAYMTNDDWIPNIDIGNDYDKKYLNANIHLDKLAHMADHFGRDMPIHLHAQYLQIHVINEGQTHFHLEQKVYHVSGRCCFLTPASTPHAILTDDDAQGSVITLHNSLVWNLLQECQVKEGYREGIPAMCIEESQIPDTQKPHWSAFLATLSLLQNEWEHTCDDKSLALETLVRLLLLHLKRISATKAKTSTSNFEEIRIFQQFCNLIEQNYTLHAPLTKYTEMLNISESRLHNICQRVSNTPPKKLINNRLIKESERLLTHTNKNMSQICYHLGFQDPSYFSRFFRKNKGINPKLFRYNLGSD